LFYFEINHDALLYRTVKLLSFQEKKKKRDITIFNIYFVCACFPNEEEFLSFALEPENNSAPKNILCMLNGLNSKEQLNNYCKYTGKFISSKSNAQVVADQF